MYQYKVVFNYLNVRKGFDESLRGGSVASSRDAVYFKFYYVFRYICYEGKSFIVQKKFFCRLNNTLLLNCLQIRDKIKI